MSEYQKHNAFRGRTASCEPAEEMSCREYQSDTLVSAVCQLRRPLPTCVASFAARPLSMVLGNSPPWVHCTGPHRIQQQHVFSATASHRSVDPSVCQSNTSQSRTPDVTGENHRRVDACTRKRMWNNKRTRATVRRRPAASKDEVDRSGEG